MFCLSEGKCTEGGEGAVSGVVGFAEQVVAVERFAGLDDEDVEQVLGCRGDFGFVDVWKGL
jgi:hypothetical protein